IFLWAWARAMNLPYRWLMLFVTTVSPILVHCYALGRPDHQSLILLLLTIALASEWTLWSRPTRGWAITNGCAWGLALWTSLYEPLVLFAVTLLFRGLLLWLPEKLAARKGETSPSVRENHRIWLANFLSLVVVLLIAVTFDGIRMHKLPKETFEY